MSHVIVLIADPRGVPLDPTLVAEVAGALGGRPRWLAEAEAAEVPVATGDGHAALALARRVAADQPLDVLAVAAADRVKRLLVADMDGTLISAECIDEMARVWGVGAEVARITRAAMNGEVEFVAALETRVARLAGLPAAALDEVYRERVRLNPGARALVRTMAGWGAITALVTGGFLPFAQRLQAELGLDVTQANRLEVLDGRLTGRILAPLRRPASKRALLEHLGQRHHLRPAQTLAVGDGANDLPMLTAAGLGVAFRPHPAVAARAPLAIARGDLTALLYLQGIARADFVLA